LTATLGWAACSSKALPLPGGAIKTGASSMKAAALKMWEFLLMFSP
jgi:hypothetical protein